MASPSTTRALSFWAYLTLAVSLLAFLLRPNTSTPPLPSSLRRHSLSGKFIKRAHLGNPTQQIFTVQSGPSDKEAAAETVLLLPGLGCSSFSFRHVMQSLSAAGIRSVSLDFPGSGLSDSLKPPKDPILRGFPNWVLAIFREIKEKGIFWAFDQLVETGQVPESRPDSAGKHVTVSEMMGTVVGEVFDALSLRAPVHVVVHDSALDAAVNWVSVNADSISSITLLDSSLNEPPAFPYGVLEVPVVGSLVLRSGFLFGWLMRLCCFRSVGLNGDDSVGVYRALMKDKDGILEIGKGLNSSFDLGEWMEEERMMKLEFQVLWSHSWTDRWIDEGKRVAAALPRARFDWHSGGRWPQVRS